MRLKHSSNFESAENVLSSNVVEFEFRHSSNQLSDLIATELTAINAALQYKCHCMPSQRNITTVTGSKATTYCRREMCILLLSL